MLDCGRIEALVEQVVGQVLDSHVAQARSEIVIRVMEEIAAQTGSAASDAPSGSGSSGLSRAISEIQIGTSQKEILRALLDSSSRYAARVALFVVKGSQATGWQARGFDDGDAIKDFALDSTATAVHKAIADRIVTNAIVGEFDARFLDQFGSPSGEIRLLPLILKDKVAALLYADGGSDGTPFDVGSLEVLVSSTSAWLEVNALRKQANKEPSAVPADGQSAPAHQMTQVNAYNDPFAGHAPAFAMAATASASAGTQDPFPGQPHEGGVVGEAQAAAVEVQSSASVMVAEVASEPSALATTGAAIEATSTETAPMPAMSPEDQDVHRKAQRFARLLVDEVKLYNQAKVAEGRKLRDLYDRLKDAIEKSRITYQKRYGKTVAASGNYFQHELVRSLAEDDASLMGPNFQL